jgi:uncharacterized membrane protein (DUF2068 family)
MPRPVGITIITGIDLVAAPFTLILSIVTAFNPFSAETRMFMAVLALLSLGSFIEGIGLLLMKDWGRILAVAMHALYTLLYLYVAFAPQFSFLLVSAIWGFIIQVIIIYYLLRPSVRAAFEQRGE